MKLLRLFTIAFCISAFITGSLKCQVLIGMSEDEIIEYMEEKNPDYVLNTGFGATANTVKFYNADKDRTWIFFLDDKGICKYSKFIFDIVEFDKTVAALDKVYTKNGELEWSLKKDSEKYILKIEKTAWMFNIVTLKAD
ncbi:MAG: hypothetical protein Kow0068_07580 [Marinilabiliales bacterium]